MMDSSTIFCLHAGVATRIKRASIIDVAESAGVSVSTVSRALNDGPLINPETKKHIFKTAIRLGFSLSPRRPGPKPGRSARKKKTAFVLFLDHRQVRNDLPPTFNILGRGVETGGRENGFLVYTQFIDLAEEKLPEAFAGEKFSGFILRGDRPSPSVEEYFKTKPCCWVLRNPWTPTWGDHVMPDHREVGMMAAEYLIRRGCRRLVQVHLGCSNRIFVLQKEGFICAADKQGIDAQSLTAKSPLPDVLSSYPEAVYVEEIIARFKKEVSSVDGIFFTDDHALAALYPVMVREKIIKPGKTVLIGCNNQQTYLKGITPHPATIDIHLELIGQAGAAQLAWRMKHPEITQRLRTLISPTLISLT